MEKIEFYCKKCRKSLKISYLVTGADEAPVLVNIRVRCQTRKCKKVVMLEEYTEKMLVLHKSKDNIVYI